MAKDDRRNLGGSRMEGAEPEERMEDWFKEDAKTSEFEEGEVVRGRVVHVGTSEVLVDVGYKSEGAIPIEEFHRHGALPKVGEEIEVYLEAKEDSEGLIVLSKDKADKIKVWDAITQAYEKGQPVEGRVVEVVKGGLAVDVGVKAFLPGSQVDLRPVKNLASMVGQTIRSKVIKLNRRRGNVVLSRRSVLEEEREEKKKHTLQVLSEGMVLTGTVKNITDYGAFIDLGGIDGLLHVTDMSWGRVGHPSEIFQVGDQVEVVVLHFDRETGRVSLGYKQKSSDPCERVEKTYAAGTKTKGKVVSLTNYGAFIELEPGVEGLVHVSEMSWTRRVRHPSKLVNVGDDRAALQARRADARPGEEPHRFRRLHRARAGGRRPPAHLGHVLDPQRGSPFGDPQEGPGDRDADPESRSREQADLPRAQADPARPVDHGPAALSDGLAGDGQDRPPHRLRRVRRAGARGRRAAAHLTDVESSDRSSRRARQRRR